MQYLAMIFDKKLIMGGIRVEGEEEMQKLWGGRE